MSTAVVILLNVLLLFEQSKTVQLKMTSERLKDTEFENEIMEQRLLKVLVICEFRRNYAIPYEDSTVLRRPTVAQQTDS